MSLNTLFARLLATALAALMCVGPAFAQTDLHLPDLGDPSQAALSPAMEAKIGTEAFREFRAEPNYVHDAEVREYLDTIGNRLVSVTTLRGQPFHFFALRDDTINAFSMPGGLVGVHTGLILTTQTESELASVLAHEIGHVEQHHIARMLSNQTLTAATVIASLLIAVLASGSHSQGTEAALATGQAMAINQQLSYSRDFEREADRIGFQTLQAAGFDVQAMPAFFERMQKANQLNEFNAVGYLSTHPLTGERIADMEGRAQHAPYKQVVDSIEYSLVRAKLDADIGAPQDAMARVMARTNSRPQDLLARAYEQTRINLRLRKFDAAAESLKQVQSLHLHSSMIDHLAADVATASGKPAEAAQICHDAEARYPAVRALVLCEAEAWLTAKQPQKTLDAVEPIIAQDRLDDRFFTLQAKAYAALGKTTEQQRAQAEVYVLMGNTAAAVEQLRLAQLGGGGDRIEQAAIDARLRELRAKLKDEQAERKGR